MTRVPFPDPSPLPLDTAFDKAQRPLDALWSSFAGVTGRGPGRTSFAFVSDEHNSGTTTLATCTALGLSRHLGEGVTLIELNYFSPAMASYLSLSPAPGLAEVLHDKVRASQAIRNSVVKGLKVMTAGAIPPPEGRLASPEARTLFGQASEGSRYVIFDCPPVIARPRGRLLLEYADWVVLVLRARSTKRHSAQAAVRLIEETGVPILGTIVNRFQSDMPFGLGASNWR
jgi:Mrp family chromosome partitioning ATPase